MIVSLERRLWDADVASDAAPYSDLIAEGFEGIRHGLLFNAKDDAPAVNQYKLRFYGMSDERVRLSRPDVALLTYRVTWSRTFAGMELPKQPISIASTWVKRAGHWKNVFYPETQPDFATAASERLSRGTVIVK